jgi:hypothetical protein
MNKKIIILLVLIVFLFSNFSFVVKAEEGRAEVPATIEGAKNVLKDMIRAGREQLPQSIKAMWNEEALPVWGKMYDWYRENIWSRVREKIENREPAVKEAFDQEKGEMATDIKKEAPKISEYLKFLWQEFKNLFQIN